MTRKPFLTRLGTVAATMVVLGASLSGQVQPAAAESAAAPTCRGWVHGNYDAGWDSIAKASYLKVGPYAVCGNIKYLRENTKVYFHCQRLNGYGHTWVYVRVEGTKKEGWVSFDNLEHWSANLIAHCDG
ncbi:hypothetical protein EDD27_9938 [Nonomuraea polychroma]|uniref:SH3 domain-containing protein n=1 Tax=Nonomuraea polychroma TaxID=46176 RepID=A0A438MN01_9ACTN|nr:hypothetical protein [Nonomuraea polychroma]RVX47019.1 hypothetical protein EDD27_9938 [Nonomuraea polychroma]